MAVGLSGGIRILAHPATVMELLAGRIRRDCRFARSEVWLNFAAKLGQK
jgi:hypothetical protein